MTSKTSSQILKTEYDEFAGMHNFDLAWRRIATSNRYEVKNWLGLQVYAWPDHKKKHLQLLLNRLDKYIPDEAHSIYQPKQDRSLRGFSFLSMDDRIVYQALGNRLLLHSYDVIKDLFDRKRIFAHIPTPPRSEMEFVFRRTFTVYNPRTRVRKIGTYDLFRREIIKTRKKLLKQFSNNSPWLIKTDIQSFYSTISHEKLLTTLKQNSWLPDDDLLCLLGKCLDKWKTSLHRAGIPIGYETSDHLANLYLIPIDMALNNFEVKRFVDDMFIFVPSFDDLKQAISLLDGVK